MDWEEFVEEGVDETLFEWIVPMVSLMLLGLITGFARLHVAEPFFFVVDLLLPALFVMLIVWQGLQLHQSDLATGQRRTVAVWYALGIYTMLGLGGWTVLLEILGQSRVPMSVEILTQVVAGGFFGLLVGTAQVRSQQNAQKATEAKLEQEFLERQQETNEVLNRILRHHLLNGLTVIRGQTQVLETHVDEDGEEYVETVIDQASEMADTIEEIRTITRTLTEDPELLPVDLASVLDAELERARRNYPEATFEVNGTDPEGIAVEANDLLGRALANVLNNGVEHNTAAEPHVEVSLTERDDEVVVAVADNGPGVADDRKTEVFEASERGMNSDGEGLGLFLTASIVRQYGGESWMEDGAPRSAAGSQPQADEHRTGSVVKLSLPKV
ncbi:ATP-binding protein [Halorientalis brevis]|uniref:histidine kinase n=2 Tax=Halorientalis brevis TaxID=1126241 RepID=A0ABD6C729_9EURY